MKMKPHVCLIPGICFLFGCPPPPGDLCGGVMCGTDEFCMVGICVPGAADSCEGVTCDAGDVCADGVCVPEAADSCEGVTCDAGEVCADGVCVPEAADPCEGVTCDAGEVCAGGVCVPAVADLCGAVTCDHGEVCVDGDCAPETADSCEGKDCSDGNECTSDVCSEGVCANPPVADGTWCFVVESGVIGECQSGACVVNGASAPTSPSGLSVTGTTSSTVSLGWTDESDDETGFRIYRSTSPSGGFAQIAETAADVTSHTDSASLSPSTKYWYQVVAFNFDGASSPSNTVSATTSTTGAPSHTFAGGSLDDLRAVSPALTFTDLTIAGVLSIDASETDVLFTVTNMTINAGVSIAHPNCFPFHDSPNLTINASGDVHVNAHISLAGKNGESESLDDPCDDCSGRNGGTFTVTAANIYVNHLVSVHGGGGSNRVLNNFPLVRSGCSGGDGGNIGLHAVDTLDLSEASDLNLEGAVGGFGYGGGPNGSDGANGVLSWSGASVAVDERWPPATCGNCSGEDNMFSYNAQWLDFANMTVYGHIQLNEEFDHRHHDGAYYWDSGTGFIDWLEDLYYLDKKEAGLVQLTLTPSNSNADLDLYILKENLTTVVGASNSTSSTEAISGTLAAGRYYIAVTYADDGENDSTDYTLEVSE